jgi:type IV pilus assembly protein PilQ
MRALLITIVSLIAVPGGAAADRDLCAPGAKFRGAPLDLDVKDADIKDVFRLLADVGKVNLVVSDAVAGKVTLRLKRVPWDQIACSVAAVHKLRILVQDTILMIDRR